jgi:hypothetical protein
MFLSYARLTTTPVSVIQFSCLMLGIILYALFSSPTPDDPGVIEGVIAVLVVLGIGIPAFYESLVLRARPLFWQIPAWLLLVYGAIVLLPLGVMMGHDAGAIARDVPPLFFIVLPLLAAPLIAQQPDFLPRLIFVFVVAGYIFALRGIFEADPFRGYAGITSTERYYFANAPTVLFAAVFPVGWALSRFIRFLQVRDFMILILCMVLAMIPLLAMVVSAQRASLASAVFIYAIFALLALYRAPVRVLPLIVLGVLAVIPFMDMVLEIVQAMIHKTQVHGINKRGLEFAAVWNEISASITSMFFGLGWGATYQSPAVGGTRVNFTHSFVSGMMLKGGLVMAFMGGAYIMCMAVCVLQVLRRNAVLGLALAGPFLINVILYASYKWLDFGLLLLIITAAVASPVAVLYAGSNNNKPFIKGSR